MQLREAGIYLAIFSNSAKIYIFYWHEILAQFVQRSINVGLLIAFWYIIGSSSGAAIDLSKLVGYFALAMLVNYMTLGNYFGIAGKIEELILSGNLSGYMLQPISSLNNIIFSAEGSDIPQRISAAIFFIIATIIMKVNLLTLLWFSLFLILGIIIGRAINVFAGAQAFWTHDRTNIRHSIYQTMLIFAGIYLPIDFLPFPIFIQNLIKYSPFGYTVYWPVKVLQGYELSLSLVLGAVLWSVVVTYLARLFWRAGLKKYGGYGL